MKGLKPATLQGFKAKKKVALKKIRRDFADESISSNFEICRDARKWRRKFSPEELAMYILNDGARSDTLPE